MHLAPLVEHYVVPFQENYADHLLAGHLNAIDAILRCRPPAAGERQVHGRACNQTVWRPLSCGHRSGPPCQTYEATRWLERQQVKLLPVAYVMVTFTLP